MMVKVSITPDKRTIIEDTRQTPVIAKVDVAVVGGGPAGIGAAISASRNGANVALIERYPYLGGMATGGLVLYLYEYDRYEYGILQEIVERMQPLGGVYYPPRKVAQELTWIEGLGVSPAYGIRFCPEVFKFVVNEMILETGVQPIFNSLFVESITVDGAVKGVIIENKEGRQALLSQVTIDATGDGDVFAGAGEEYDVNPHAWGMSLSWRVANVDTDRYMTFREEQPDQYQTLMNELMQITQQSRPMRCQPEGYYNGLALSFGPYFLDLSAIRVNDLMTVEIEGRKKVMTAMTFYKQHMPGFESAILIQTSSQIGTRCSRRLVGEYVLTKEDILAERRFPDAVASNLYDIPYRILVPKTVNRLLASGRCLSTTREAQESIREISPCLITGQIAGAAAAQASKHSQEPREIDVGQLQDTLQTQGVVIYR